MRNKTRPHFEFEVKPTDEKAYNGVAYIIEKH